MNPKDIQIIINSRDRLTPLRELISWLQRFGYRKLCILDNDSTYPSLLEYYKEIEEGITIWRTGKNLLSKALWTWPRANEFIETPFVYTDSDIVPTEECPGDVIEFLMKVSERLGKPYKVGLSLISDDIPDCYSQAAKVRAWEAQNWNVLGNVDNVPIYSAGVDTTFALYSYWAPFQISGVRVGAPYSARHMPWYADSANPTEEETYYEEHVAYGTHNWGVNGCYSVAVDAYYDDMKKNEMNSQVDIQGGVQKGDSPATSQSQIDIHVKVHVDTSNIPVIINNFNRLTYLQRLVNWLLENTDTKHIVILDNASAYPLLVQWYARQQDKRIEIRKLRRNFGSQALWKQPDKSLLTLPFVYTDPDVVPDDNCPKDLIEFLLRTWQECSEQLISSWDNKQPQKIGPGLKVSDIPHRYALKNRVIMWEEQHTGLDKERMEYDGVKLYDVAIDSTFALYCGYASPFGLSAIRTGEPYLVKHLPWYVDSGKPSSEELFYERYCDKHVTNWGIKRCYSNAVNQMFTQNQQRK